MPKTAKTPQRAISENMIKAMKMLIATDVIKNRVQFASRLKMNQNSIYRIEKDPDYSFTLEQFYRFCQQFKIDPDTLFPK